MFLAIRVLAFIGVGHGLTLETGILIFSVPSAAVSDGVLAETSFERLEDEMNDKHFDSPVFIKLGNRVLQITRLSQALEFLDQWPRSRRDGFYETARWACFSCFVDRMTVGSARQGFAGWAKTAGILADAPAEAITPVDRELHAIAA